MKFKPISEDAMGIIKTRTFNEISKHFMATTYHIFSDLYNQMADRGLNEREIFLKAVQQALKDKEEKGNEI